jgi:hypothetical protein
VGDSGEKKRIAEQFMRVGESKEQRNHRVVEEMFRGFGSQGFEDFINRGAKIQAERNSPPQNANATVGAFVVQCGSCGQKNRVKVAFVGQPRCGKCKKDLGVYRG